jgi:succinate dehydrogenase / fumarate reductase cytochrome b subunit
MSFRGFARKFVDEAKLNQSIGMLSYILHRFTGIALAVYLIVHTWVLSSAREGQARFTEQLGAVQGPVFHFFELFLSAAVFFHMLNGVRIIVADFIALTRWHRVIFWIVIALFIAAMAWNLAVVVPRLLGH